MNNILGGHRSSSTDSLAWQHLRPFDTAALTPPSLPSSPEDQGCINYARNYPAQLLLQGSPTPPPEPNEVAQQSYHPHYPSRDVMAPGPTAPSFKQGWQVTQYPDPVAPMGFWADAKLMPPPPRPVARPIKKPTSRRKPAPASISVPAIDLESSQPYWQCNTDPSLRTQTQMPRPGQKNPSMPSSDCKLDFGNVTSPTWMILLPFGGTIELAGVYGSEEAVQ